MNAPHDTPVLDDAVVVGGGGGSVVVGGIADAVKQIWQISQCTAKIVTV